MCADDAGVERRAKSQVGVDDKLGFRGLHRFFLQDFGIRDVMKKRERKETREPEQELTKKERDQSRVESMNGARRSGRRTCLVYG